MANQPRRPAFLLLAAAIALAGIIVLATACVQLRMYSERLLRRAFSLIELLLYMALLMAAVPILLATVRLASHLQRRVQNAVIVQVYHRAACDQLVRDVALAENWQLSDDNELVVTGTNFRGAWTPQPWRVTYQLRDDGLFRRRERTTTGGVKKSSVRMAPRPQGFAIDVAGEVSVVYQATAEVQWRCVVPRVAGVML